MYRVEFGALVSGDINELISANVFPLKCNFASICFKILLLGDNVIFKKQNLQLDCLLEGHNQQACDDFLSPTNISIPDFETVMERLHEL